MIKINIFTKKYIFSAFITENKLASNIFKIFKKINEKFINYKSKKKCISTLLSILVTFILYPQKGVTIDFNRKCKPKVPIYVHSLTENNINNFPITINANCATGDCSGKIIFSGNVDIEQGNNHLKADEVQLHKEQKKGKTSPVHIVNMFGNVHFYDKKIFLRGKKGWINLNTKDANIWNGEYQIANHKGNGKAALIKQRAENRYVIFEKGSFSLCPPESKTWNIIGSKIIYDQREEITKIWNAYLKFGSVPIFYIPYLKFSDGKKPYSGFLSPKIKYSTLNRFDLNLPYYWRILPDIDATIIPHYIHKYSDIFLENKLHYVTHVGSGVIRLNYFLLDSIPWKRKTLMRENFYYWLFFWKHSLVLNQIWNFDVDYTKINNSKYTNLSDLKDDLNVNEHAKQSFCIGYSVPNFTAKFLTKRFQKLNNYSENSYAAIPQFDINWYKKNFKPFNFQIYSQITHFINNNSDMPKSTRFHFEPIINFPWFNSLINVNTEIKLMATHYQQTNFCKYNKRYGLHIKNSVNRILPQLKIEGKMELEKDKKKSLKNNYTQTLEPRIQYMYVPYREQSKIQNYDSSLLKLRYDALFYNHLYSGLDRIPHANQITIGVKTQIRNNQTRIKYFHASIGQIYSLTRTHSTDLNSNQEKDRKSGLLSCFGSIYLRVKDHYGFCSNLQYGPYSKNITTGNGVIEYRKNDDRLMQLNYRYAKLDNIHNNEHIYKDNTVSSYKEKISQVGAVINWPIFNQWSVIGSYYYSINEKKTTDQMIGFQYSSCCYAVHLNYERKLSNSYVKENENKHNIVLGFSVELRGFDSNHELNAKKMLRSNLIPYRSLIEE